MKHSFQLFLILCSLSVFPSVAYAKDDGHDKDRVFIKVAYADVDKATNKKDVDGVTAFLTDDYVSVNQKGVVDAHNKAEEVQTIRELFQYVTNLSTQTKIIAISFSKQGATVTNASKITFTAYKDGKQATQFTQIGMYRDQWVQSKSGLLEKSSTTITTKITMTGKPTV